ncbi:MAG TPA: hypothetical protein VFJ47_00835 [Terriglobales bacterium]|nr:hypothetical protein [Terriglobales bacterium]
MAVAELLPELDVQLDYWTWLREVKNLLEGMNTEMGPWLENWDFDFREEYDAGATPDEAATRAHDYWWQQLLAESWT